MKKIMSKGLIGFCSGPDLATQAPFELSSFEHVQWSEVEIMLEEGCGLGNFNFLVKFKV